MFVRLSQLEELPPELHQKSGLVESLLEIYDSLIVVALELGHPLWPRSLPKRRSSMLKHLRLEEIGDAMLYRHWFLLGHVQESARFCFQEGRRIKNEDKMRDTFRVSFRACLRRSILGKSPYTFAELCPHTVRGREKARSPHVDFDVSAFVNRGRSPAYMLVRLTIYIPTQMRKELVLSLRCKEALQIDT